MSKKKIIVACLILAMVFSLGVMTACDGGQANKLTLIEGKQATCTEDGYSTYYINNETGEIFSDAEGKNKTTQEAIKIPALGHDLVLVEAKAATCTEEGNVAYYHCNRCGDNFSDSEGKNKLNSVVIPIHHELEKHAMVPPTVDSEGSREYWKCKVCGKIFADAYGDSETTLEELKIDKLSENVDGVLTSGFYNSSKDFTVGGPDVKEGGIGFVANSKLAEDGVYLHIVVNYNTSYNDQVSGCGKLGVYMNFRNKTDYNLPGGVGVSIEKAMLMEIYLNGNVSFHSPFMLKYYNTAENAADAKTKYTTTWEFFMPNKQLAEVNSGVFAGAFETSSHGKVILKAGYNAMMTIIGNMTYKDTSSDKFEENGESKCTLKDDNKWVFWLKEGYGDWGSDQKYMIVSKDGFSKTFVNSTTEYKINVAQYENAQIDFPKTVEANGELSGTATVDEGYRLSGIIINGYKYNVTKKSDGTYTYNLPISSLTIDWFATELEVEPVITKLEYQDISLKVEGIKDGKTAPLPEGTSVTLSSGYGDDITASVGKNGIASIENALCIEYSVKVTGYLDGSYTVVLNEKSGSVALEYELATPITYPEIVDLTKMNSETAEITMNTRGRDGVNNTYAVRLNLSEEIQNAKQFVLYTTVKVNDPQPAGGWGQRFAINLIKEGNRAYNTKVIAWWGDLLTNNMPFFYLQDEELPTGSGWTGAPKGPQWFMDAVMEGLQLKIVRNGGLITVSAYDYNDEEWYMVLSGSTSATALNDIIFFSSWESWTFSGIKTEVLSEVASVMPSSGKDGVIAHLVAPNGDLFDLNGGYTQESKLVIEYGSVAYSDYDNVSIDQEAGTITILGEGIKDRDNRRKTNAIYFLPENVSGKTEISLMFTVKDIEESSASGSDWAARRFGVQIGSGAYGFYFWTPSSTEFYAKKFSSGTLDMNTDNSADDLVRADWIAKAIRSEEGLKIKVARIGEKLVLSVCQSDGKWIKLCETDCPNNIASEIRFVGGGDTWEVSNIASGALSFVEAKDWTADKDGNIDHYTDGTNYYKKDGTAVFADDVIIKKVSVNITVKAFEADGTTPITLAAGTQIELTGKFQNYTLTVGGDSLEVIVDTYSVYLYGYERTTLKIEPATVNAELILTKAYAYIENGNHEGGSGVVLDGANNKIIIKGNGLKEERYGFTVWSGSAEIILDSSVLGTQDIEVAFTVQKTVRRSDSWNWAMENFGVQITGNQGLQIFAPFDNEVNFKKMYGEGEKQLARIDKFASLLNGEGLKIKIVRLGAKMYVYAFDGTNWEQAAVISCDASDKNRVIFSGAGDDWTFSEIAVSSYVKNEIAIEKGKDYEGVTLDIVSKFTQGEDITLTLSSEAGYKAFAVEINGKTLSLSLGQITIKYDDLKINYGVKSISVSVVSATSTSASATNQRLTTGTADFDADEFNGKEVIGYVRYVLSGTLEKGDIAGDELDGVTRRGADFAGDDPFKFIAKGNTSADCLFLNPNIYSSLTLHVKKGATSILVYGGTYNANNTLVFKLIENGIEIADGSFYLSQLRAYVVEFEIDTTGWTEESRDIILYFGSKTDCEMAGVLILGGEYVKSYGIIKTDVDNAVITVPASVRSGEKLTGKVTAEQGYTVDKVVINGKEFDVDENGDFSVDLSDLELLDTDTNIMVTATVTENA